MALIDLLRAVQVVVFVSLGVLAFVHWRRQRGPAGWLALSFGLLGAVVLVGRVAPPTDTTAGFIIQKGQITLLALFPYFLFRFKRAFVRDSRVMLWIATGLTAVLIVWLVVLPDPISADVDAPPFVRGAVYLLLAQWVVLTTFVAARLWKAGKGEPPVARARMRSLGGGAVLLAAALLFAGFAPGEGFTPYATVLLAITSGLVFYLAFVPPGFVRAAWRRGTESRLWEIERELVTATTPEEIGERLLPVVRDSLGAEAAVLTSSEGDVIAVDGMSWEQAEQAIAAERTAILTVELRSGELATVQGQFSPYFGKDEENLLRSFGVLTDLALERADLFDQERRARVQAEAAREELEALVYGLSHDLKSPVVTVLGYAELLRTDYAEVLGTAGAEFLDRLTANVDYMQALLNDLLDLSRVGRVQTEPDEVDLNALAAEIADEVTDAHPEVTVDVGELPVVWINPVRARQLLRNLVENAVTHGGREDITVRIDGGYVSDRARFVVKDDGVGIPSEQHERVFGIFERFGPREPDNPGSGTGIGLAMCRRIVETAGGVVQVLDDSPPGTTIEVELPTGRDAGRGGRQSSRSVQELLETEGTA
jgi:signal transduction histidine kinase